MHAETWVIKSPARHLVVSMGRTPNPPGAAEHQEQPWRPRRHLLSGALMGASSFISRFLHLSASEVRDS